MRQIDYRVDNFGFTSQMSDAWLDRHNEEGKILLMDEKIGKGLSFYKWLEQGLFVGAWNYELEEATRISIHPANPGSPEIFTISYLLTNDAYFIEVSSPDAGKLRKVNILNNMVLHSNQTSDFSYIIKKGTRARSFDILFSSEWLIKQFPSGKVIDIRTILETHAASRSVYFEPLSSRDYKVVDELIDKIFQEEWNNIFLKSGVMFLMNQLVTRMWSVKSKTNDATAIAHSSAIVEVERMLSETLYDKLPGVKLIAKKFAMSESTLKRQFKQQYGKAIYEYYLEKKMELARLLLIEKNQSISQVAYALGYEKASSFIRSFKKHFGVSPGSLRMENASQ